MLNYRTRAGIIDWAKSLLPPGGVDDLDTGVTDLSGYRSVVDGPPPIVRGFDTEQFERIALAEQIAAWIKEGVKAENIGCLCRANRQCTALVEWLVEHGVPAVQIKRREDRAVPGSVNVMTMHRVKGLEFRAVAITGIGASSMPLPQGLQEANGDAAEEEQFIDGERRLLFTACTRPRDYLWVSWSGERSPLLPAGVPASHQD